MRLAVVVALLDVVDAAAALLGRHGRLVLLVHAQHVDADPGVLERVARQLRERRDQVRVRGLGLEVGRERVEREGGEGALFVCCRLFSICPMYIYIYLQWEGGKGGIGMIS